MTGWARSMPQKSGMRHLCDGVAAHDRAVDAEPDVSPIHPRHRAAEAGAETAGHRRLHRQLAGHLVLRTKSANGLQHRRGAAGVDDSGGGVVAGQHRGEKVGDVALVAGVAVLAGEADVGAEGAAGAEELLEAAGMLLVAEAEQDAEGDAALYEVAAPDRHRRDPDPAADE